MEKLEVNKSLCTRENLKIFRTRINNPSYLLSQFLMIIKQENSSDWQKISQIYSLKSNNYARNFAMLT